MINQFVWTDKSVNRNRLTQIYEPFQPYFFVELAKAISVDAVIDVGANIGFYSVVMGALKSVKKIYSFEPINDAFEELQINISLNNLTNKSVLLNTALSDSRAVEKMNVFGKLSGANSIASSSIHTSKSPLKTIEIETDTLDRLVELEGATIAIKIDVEGHELEVLRGAKGLLGEHKGVMQIELYGSDLRKNKIIDWLGEIGWHKIFTAGPDAYFSNVPKLENSDCLVVLLENSIRGMLARGEVYGPNLNIKRRIGFGLSVELSGGSARFLRRMFSRG